MSEMSSDDLLLGRCPHLGVTFTGSPNQPDRPGGRRVIGVDVMQKACRCMVAALTVGAWVALVVAALPMWDMAADVGLLVQTIAALGTCWFIVRTAAAPALEVYLAGKRAGRSEVLA